MIIQHNMAAMNSSRELGITGKNLQKRTEKLSSGYRINRAADDAAGLAISEKMRGQIRGLTQASTNSEDAISLVQTAEGALQESQNVIHRMRELAVQAANDTNTDDDRAQIQKEIKQLTNEIDRIATATEFNTKKLLDGSQRGMIAWRDGEVSIDGSFQSGYVSVQNVAASDAVLCAIDDVIRITVQRDITATAWESETGYDTELYADIVSTAYADSTRGLDAYLQVKESITAGARLTFDSLQGTTFKQPFHIYEAEPGSGTAILAISYGAYDSKSTVVNSQAGTRQLEFRIEGFRNLKAGDVITIALNKAQQSKAMEPGKEPLRFQVGANAGQEVTLNIESMKAKDLGIIQTSNSFSDAATADTGAALDVTNQAKASLAIEAYDQALTRISVQRAALGAVQNRLEHTIANLDTSAENLQASESRIRDADMADEMVDYSKNNILQQAGTSMLSNANSSTQTVLQLLQQ